jgi:hypothetical protein
MVRQEVAACTAPPRPPAYALHYGIGTGFPVAVVAGVVIGLEADTIAVLDFLYPEAVRVRSRHCDTSLSVRSIVERFRPPIDGLTY